ncbi:MAG: HNH endonuclease signature motif containing protein [bacterium]|nr:HNH endonuclease signature motif containing protein [bacterium]
MKIKESSRFSRIKKNNEGRYVVAFLSSSGERFEVEIEKIEPKITKFIDFEKNDPIFFRDGEFCGSKLFILKNFILEIEGVGEQLEADEILRVKHFVLKKEKELEKISKEIEAFENFDKIQLSKRDRISDSVRLFVWQRDEGKCVICGNKEKIEFDHIIPVVEGGANTERNIQILCESCNRSKGKKI